jgi:diacylglycerol kinase family enzyme
MRPRAFVLVNPRAGGGRGRARLERAWPAVAARFEPTTVELEPSGRWRAELRAGVDGGVRHFVAAGGDGTVGALVDGLWRVSRVPLSHLTVGAVGVGSSNDFHKPVRARAGGLPIRIGAPAGRDVGCVRYVDETGTARARAFLVSASFGVTAAANAFFDGNDRLMRLLRRAWTDGAVLYAALHEILRGRSQPLDLALAGSRWRVRAASLSVLKTPHLAGGLAYDTPVSPDDGVLAVNLVEDRGRRATLATLAGLARGRFAGRPGTRHWCVPELTVESVAPVPLEIDGEVVLARRAAFEVLAERIRACA